MARKIVAPMTADAPASLGLERPVELGDETRAAGARGIRNLGRPERYEARQLGRTFVCGPLPAFGVPVVGGRTGTKDGTHR